MNELRKDYILNRFVIVAKDRGKRPHILKEARAVEEGRDSCPFCPGHEHLLAGILNEIKKDDSWIIRVVPNKFSAVSLEGDPHIQMHNKFYTFASAYGTHEVIIETPEHGKELEELPQEHIQSVLKTYVWRIRELNDLANIKYISVFKNRGTAAGASLRHSHSQIIAYNIKPSWISEELMTAYKYLIENESCPYCEIIEQEKASDRRVFEDEHFVAFTPYASRFPYEVWVFPKNHYPNIALLRNEELFALAGVLKKLLLRLDDLGYPPFNLKIHNADLKGENFHFHIEISPRLAIWAGFELETGTVINTVSPEDAAKFYRGE
jgi:UDPglucose--hexose-1-phosphate uridylyltransferase